MMLEGSTVVFAMQLKKRVKTYKLKKEDLKGIKRDGFELLNSIFKSNIEFEYNLEQVALAMTTIQSEYTSTSLLQQGFRVFDSWKHVEEICSITTKYPAAFYNQDGIQEEINNLFRSSVVEYNVDVELGIHHWPKLRKSFYKARKASMSMHKVQGKLHHLPGDVEYDLVKSLLIYIRSLVIKKRVEDV
ncbi:hypothetical protein Tco_0359106 [Tanacetum coccineum]